MAASLTTLIRVRGSMVRNSLRTVRQHSSLKISVVVFFAAGLWVGLYLLFNDAYRFYGATTLLDFRPMIVQVAFAAFFLSLLILLAFSNGIIAYGSLFRSEETAYLFSSPFSSWQVFAYKLSESLLFSSWAFLFLALPLIAAVGVNEHAPWYYYPGAALFFATFAIDPRGGGREHHAAHREVPATFAPPGAGRPGGDRGRADPGVERAVLPVLPLRSVLCGARAGSNRASDASA